jgi:transposase
VAKVREKIGPATPIEIWFQDEMRVGQKNKLTYTWARRGSRPRLAHDQRTQSAYVFGAVCPERGTGAALILPRCNTRAMQMHLQEIATQIAPDAHALLICDQAGWHTTGVLAVPNNITIMLLPPRSPELNPAENIWQYMRQNWLSNRIFATYDDIVGLCAEAWNKLIDRPWTIMSVALRHWAIVSHHP